MTWCYFLLFYKNFAIWINSCKSFGFARRSSFSFDFVFESGSGDPEAAKLSYIIKQTQYNSSNAFGWFINVIKVLNIPFGANSEKNPNLKIELVK